MEGGCGDDAVGHVGNCVSRNAPQGASDVVIERTDLECGIVLAELADEPLECIGSDTPAFDQVDDLDKRDG